MVREKPVRIYLDRETKDILIDDAKKRGLTFTKHLMDVLKLGMDEYDIKSKLNNGKLFNNRGRSDD